MLKSTQHLDFAQLLDFAEGKTPNGQRKSLSSHLELCSKCSDLWREVEEMLSLMRTDTAVDPPRDVVALAVSLFNSRQKQPSAIRRLVALLSFDSLTEAPAFGFRSSASTSRQLLYSIDEGEIDLRVTQEAGRWILTGQILGFEECQSCRIDIVGEGVSESTALNELCEFKLPPVDSGIYQLTLRFLDTEVEVPRLELRA